MTAEIGRGHVASLLKLAGMEQAADATGCFSENESRHRRCEHDRARRWLRVARMDFDSFRNVTISRFAAGNAHVIALRHAVADIGSCQIPALVQEPG